MSYASDQHSCQMLIGYTRGKRGAAHLSVLIQDDNHARVQVGGTVHGLPRHTSRNGTIADDSDAVIGLRGVR